MSKEKLLIVKEWLEKELEHAKDNVQKMLEDALTGMCINNGVIKDFDKETYLHFISIKRYLEFEIGQIDFDLDIKKDENTGFMEEQYE